MGKHLVLLMGSPRLDLPGALRRAVRQQFAQGQFPIDGLTTLVEARHDADFLRGFDFS